MTGSLFILLKGVRDLHFQKGFWLKKKPLLNVIRSRLNPFFVFILLQEETSEFIQAGDNSNLTSGDCGVPGWDTVESCGFWMEGVMLTCTGK